MAEDTALRHELRENGVEYSVVKNTLVRRAIDQVGMSELDSILNGTTSLAISRKTPSPHASLTSTPSRWATGLILRPASWRVKSCPWRISPPWPRLPSKDGLVAQLLGMMLAPHHQPRPSLSRPSPSRAGRALLPPRPGPAAE